MTYPDPEEAQFLQSLAVQADQGQQLPVDFNIEVITNDDDIVTLIKEEHPELKGLLLPAISRLNSLSYIGTEEEKRWWQNEVEILIEETALEIDETDLKTWNFLKGLRFRLLFMINDAYKGHKSRVIRERRTVYGWEPPERKERGSSWWRIR